VKYRVFAALYEEATAGWVWLASPRLEPHRLVILRNQDLKSHPVIYCEGRSLDENFVAFYNAKPHTRKIDPKNFGDVLVIGDWYRQGLGIPTTKTEVELEVRQPKNPFWPALRAGSQHPDPTVRLANRLGLLGTWLGLVGVVGAVIPFIDAIRQAMKGDCRNVYSTGASLLFILVVGLVCLWGARGVRRLGNST
jgi:hypothetical protein